MCCALDSDMSPLYVVGAGGRGAASAGQPDSSGRAAPSGASAVADLIYLERIETVFAVVVVREVADFLFDFGKGNVAAGV